MVGDDTEEARVGKELEPKIEKPPKRPPEEQEGSWVEALVAVDVKEQFDLLTGAEILKNGCSGKVVAIQDGKISKERLYLVRYEGDGEEAEYLTALHVMSRVHKLRAEVQENIAELQTKVAANETKIARTEADIASLQGNRRVKWESGAYDLLDVSKSLFICSVCSEFGRSAW